MNIRREDDRRGEFKYRLVDQLLGAFVTFLLIGFIGWLAGFGEVRRDTADALKSIVKIESAMMAAQKDIADLKMGGMTSDAALDKRVSIMEEQHRELLRRGR